jgi:hypothetical protein
MADEHIVTIHEKFGDVAETLIKFNVTSLISCSHTCLILSFDSLRRQNLGILVSAFAIAAEYLEMNCDAPSIALLQ